jgi:hypothetical protein
MTTSFRTKYPVIKREAGQWNAGYYTPDTQGTEIEVMMTIQQPGSGDNNAIASLPMGSRVSRYIKVYTDTRLNTVSQEPSGSPGDIVLFDNKQFLIIGESHFQTMKRTRANSPVSHFRYYAAEVVEDEVKVNPYG